MTKNIYQFLDNPALIQSSTRFWFIRHAIVNQTDRNYLYGSMDVPLCPDHIKQQQHIYHHLAKRLPQTKSWITSSLSRTQDTARLIQNAGYGHHPFQIDNSFLEQDLGEWQGLTHGIASKYCQYPSHPFWPFCAKERPPHGENMYDVIHRVGPRLKQLADINQGQDIIIVSHGGAIRAAIAYSLRIPLDSALSLSILNLSITILEKNKDNWRALTINEYPTT
ncbi:histidine phosphatase family protein [Commensalibacter papalotli (ex Botero et al. 2024)]|uniref:Broad specificity phosphatase PhoE (PhoE) (PDB:1EBB) n=1 Tax=Commensalibacter papalotli (ex Botero et al. 2024) TaxID=2972766 RepID=A0ABN8WA23_9PROT|nr:histidine phosphatase family protein [Commensalibacter papalotli (ex Botero et al. 2024)]CAI3942765.1 Broad specificity phosphatase PhoE (PhoE) (PDB:1EBB) [Commensalibacter papalotli (ex Botero et al. 2024)]CAI3948164.1 Broad specificity phosphatase PhoE (PhoE) (PDB:1EBB) [Commensalibacter papalotli (ex Botero et al. 2024)]